MELGGRSFDLGNLGLDYGDKSLNLGTGVWGGRVEMDVGVGVWILLSDLELS